MKIFAFGNSDIREDSIAIRIIPKLKKQFPHIQFVLYNPIDDIETLKSIYILDSAKGIDNVTLITNMKQLKKSNSSTQHDFDIAFQLQILRKIGRIQQFNMIAIPYDMGEKQAVKQVSTIIKSKLLRENS